MTSFAVRKHTRKDGAVTYYVVRKEKRANGKGWTNIVVESGIESEREALRIKKAAKKAWRDQKHGVTTHTPTVDATLDGYLASIASQSGHDNAERYARLHLRPALGAIEIGELTVDQVQAVIDTRKPLMEPQSLHHIRGTLRAALNWAKAKKLVTGDNVASAVVLPRIKKKLKDTLEPEEAYAILRHGIAHEEAPLLAFSFFSGARPGELAALAPSDVKLSARLIRVTKSNDNDETKTGDERWLPIADPLVPYVEEALKHAKGGLVFPPGRGGQRLADRKTSEMLRAAMVRTAALGHCPALVTSWTNKCRRSGCGFSEETALFVGDKRCPRCNFILWPVGHARKIRYYDMRHTTATLLVEAGVEPAIVAAIIGHTDVNFTMETYVHLKPAKLVAAVNKLSLGHVHDGRGQPVDNAKVGTR